KDADRIILDFREKGRRGRSPFSSRAGLGRDRGRNGPTPLFLSAPKYLNNKATSSGCNYDEIGGPRARAAGGARPRDAARALPSDGRMPLPREARVRPLHAEPDQGHEPPRPRAGGGRGRLRRRDA